MASRSRSFRMLLVFFLLCSILFVIPPGSRSAQSADAAQPLVAFTKNGDIWLMNADGSNQKPITDDGAPENDFQGTRYSWYEWSPDGAYLLIVRQGPSNAGQAAMQLQVYAVASGERTTLIESLPQSTMRPSWALDTNRIAYVSAESSDDMRQSLQPVSLEAVDLDGTISPLATFNAQTCGVPEGFNPDPALELFMTEFGPIFGFLDYQSIFWNTTANTLHFDNRCENSVNVDLSTGISTEDPLDRTSANLSGEVAGNIPNSSSIGKGPDLGIEANGATRILRPGELPVWASQSGDLFFVSRTQDGAQVVLQPGESGLNSLVLGFYRNSLWRAPADGSAPVKLFERASYSLGRPSAAADGSFVVLTRIDNSTDLWENRLAGDTYTTALLDEFGPRARIQRLDVKSGTLTTLVTDAFRPKVQPVVITPSSPPTLSTPTTQGASGASDLAPAMKLEDIRARLNFPFAA